MYRILQTMILVSLILSSIHTAQAARISPITWDQGSRLLTACTNSPDAKTSEPLGLVTKCCSVSLGYCVTCPVSSAAGDNAKICRKGNYLASKSEELNANIKNSGGAVVKPSPSKKTLDYGPKPDSLPVDNKASKSAVSP